jgi:hypothetical protein
MEGLQARFLPEPSFRGRQHKKHQYAILAAAALRGGTEADLLDEVALWQTDDFWEYALYARSSTSAPPPARQASRYARHARAGPAPRRGHPAP